MSLCYDVPYKQHLQMPMGQLNIYGNFSLSTLASLHFQQLIETIDLYNNLFLFLTLTAFGTLSE